MLEKIGSDRGVFGAGWGWGGVTPWLAGGLSQSGITSKLPEPHLPM